MGLLFLFVLGVCVVLHYVPTVGPHTLFAMCAPLLIAHTAIEEVQGAGGPFWAYYHSHFGGPRVGYAVGLALFLALTASLLTLAVLGLLCGSVIALSLLVGLMLADAQLSHLLLRFVFRVDNPGQWTAMAYLAFIALVVLDGAPDLSGAWVAIGTVPFAAFWAVSWLLKWLRAADVDRPV